MVFSRPAVVGVGATGAAIAAAVLKTFPEAMLVVTNEGSRATLLGEGIKVDGALNFEAWPVNVASSIAGLDAYKPDVVYICTKTFHLPRVVSELAALKHQGFTVVSCHNGLGTEDYLAETFGALRVLRMTLNYGAASEATGRAHAAFFNSPNHMGPLAPESQQSAASAARILAEGGLATDPVEDVKLYVWRKMIMKCSMASIGAVTDWTIRDCLRFPPTREIAFGCFGEAMAVAKACGYDLGEGYIDKAVAYIEEVGIHRDSMCHDIAAGRQTEIGFLGAKIVEYGRKFGIPTPHYDVMTNLVLALEKKVAGVNKSA